MPYKAEIPNRFLNTWVALFQVYKLVSRAEEMAYAEIGVTSQQHAVLAAINSIEGPVTPSEVSHWLYQNPNGVSMLVNRMERDGLVKRLRSSRDRRAVHLTLTKKGENILERSTVVGMQVVNKIMGELSEAELDVLAGLLERLRGVAVVQVSPGESVKEIKMRRGADIDRFLARKSGKSEDSK